MLLVLGTGAGADSDLKIAGTIAAGGPLTLPLVAGASATVIVALGLEQIFVPITITGQTVVEAEETLPIGLSNGDRVKIEVQLAGGALVAGRLKVDEFPELKIRGTVQGTPGGSATLPVTPGAVLDFTIVLVGIPLPVRVTSATRIEDLAGTINDGQVLRIEGSIRGGAIVATELEGDPSSDN
jgi:hypothetical protein